MRCRQCLPARHPGFGDWGWDLEVPPGWSLIATASAVQVLAGTGLPTMAGDRLIPNGKEVGIRHSGVRLGGTALIHFQVVADSNVESLRSQLRGNVLGGKGAVPADILEETSNDSRLWHLTTNRGGPSVAMRFPHEGPELGGFFLDYLTEVEMTPSDYSLAWARAWSLPFESTEALQHIGAAEVVEYVGAHDQSGIVGNSLAEAGLRKMFDLEFRAHRRADAIARSSQDQGGAALALGGTILGNLRRRGDLIFSPHY